MSFVHLHNHSDYSLLDGAIRVSELVEFAKTNGMGAVALTDHGNMFGMIDFINACQEKGVKAIPGQECYFTAGSRHARSKEQPTFHMTVLAMNQTGYHNLCKLSSLAYLEGFYYKPRLDWELLKTYHEGLIILSGCLRGFLPYHLLKGDRAAAMEHAAQMKALLGPDRYYIEIMRADMEEQERVIPMLAELADALDLGLVATNDCHYFRKNDSILQELLICIASGKTMSDPTRLKFSSKEFYLKTPAAMAALFPDYPEALKNTRKIADMVNVSLKRESYHLPHFDVPKGYATSDAYLRHLAEEGLKKRLAEGRPRLRPLEAYKDRLEMELNVICDMAFPGYFLILHDILAHARRQGIPVGPGRGSSAGSLVSYALEIVDIDPLEYDLIFERFLNPARISMPDIDVDVCQRRRGEVLQYIREKFGERSVCQIVTFKPLKSKGVVRDVARILGMEFSVGDEIARAIPDPKMSIEEAKAANPALLEMEQKNEKVRELLEFARRLTGLNRNLSVHAAGVVITPGETSDFVPLAVGPRGEEVITQYTFEPLEKLGLLKMDILGLATLTVVYDTLADIRARLGLAIDPQKIPLDDPEVFALFGRGETDGIFQFESDGMKDYLRRLRPSAINDLIAMNALYRPGALKAGMVDVYVQCKNGEKSVNYIVPELEPILSETFGVIVYQEQVMRIAVDIAGYTMAKADLLRKAMGKKKAEVMQQEKEDFVHGAKAKGFKERDARAIFEQIEPFAGYGFNKSHSVSYAVLAYITAWLKVHYAPYFMARLIGSEISDTDQMVKYIHASQAMGLKILPPDIAASRVEFSVEDGDIRFGLEGIKGVGESAARVVVEAHGDRPFTGIGDLLGRLDGNLVNKKVLEALIKAGAFDRLHPSRSALFSNVESLMGMGQKRRAEQQAKQSSLFAAEEIASDTALSDPDPWPDHERLAFEKQAIGFYFSGHPLAGYTRLIRLFTDTPLADLPAWNGHTVRVAGVIEGMQMTATKSGAGPGRPYARFELEDEGGRARAVVLPNIYGQLAGVLKEAVEKAAVVLVKGRVTANENGAEIMVQELFPITEAPKRGASGLMIRLTAAVDESRVQELQALLRSRPGPLPVQFTVIQEGTYRVQLKPALPLLVQADEDLIEKIKARLGENSAYYLF